MHGSMVAQGNARGIVTIIGSNNQAKQVKTGTIGRDYAPGSIEYVEVAKAPAGHWLVKCAGGQSPGAFPCAEMALQAGRRIASREGVELRAPHYRPTGSRLVLTGWRE